MKKPITLFAVAAANVALAQDGGRVNHRRPRFTNPFARGSKIIHGPRNTAATPTHRSSSLGVAQPGKVLTKAEREKRKQERVDSMMGILDGQVEEQPSVFPYSGIFITPNLPLTAKLSQFLQRLSTTFDDAILEEWAWDTEGFHRGRHTYNLRALIVFVIALLLVFGALYTLVEYLLLVTRAFACSISTVYIPVPYAMTSSMPTDPSSSLVSPAEGDEGSVTTTLTATSTSTSTQTHTSTLTIQPAVTQVTALTSSDGPSYFYTVNTAGSTDWVSGVSPTAGASLTTAITTILVQPTPSTSSAPSGSAVSIQSTVTDLTTVTPPAYTSTVYSYAGPDLTSTSTSTHYVTYTVAPAGSSPMTTDTRTSFSGIGSGGWNVSTTLSASGPVDPIATTLDPVSTTLTGIYYFGTGDQTTSTSTTLITTMISVAWTTTLTPAVSSDGYVTTITALPVTISAGTGASPFSTSIPLSVPSTMRSSSSSLATSVSSSSVGSGQSTRPSLVPGTSGGYSNVTSVVGPTGASPAGSSASKSGSSSKAAKGTDAGGMSKSKTMQSSLSAPTTTIFGTNPAGTGPKMSGTASGRASRVPSDSLASNPSGGQTSNSRTGDAETASSEPSLTSTLTNASGRLPDTRGPKSGTVSIDQTVSASPLTGSRLSTVPGASPAEESTATRPSVSSSVEQSQSIPGYYPPAGTSTTKATVVTGTLVSSGTTSSVSVIPTSSNASKTSSGSISAAVTSSSAEPSFSILTTSPTLQTETVPARSSSEFTSSEVPTTAVATDSSFAILTTSATMQTSQVPARSSGTESTGSTSSLPLSSEPTSSPQTSPSSTSGTSSEPSSSGAEIRTSVTSTSTTSIDPTSSASLSNPFPASSATAEPSAGCGEHGDFMIDFDDLPRFIPNEQSQPDISNAPPVQNPYRHLTFSGGYVYAPPPDAQEPFTPTSEPHLAVFLPDDNGLKASSFGDMVKPGEIGDGPRDSMSAFWFNAYSASFGCGGRAPDVCSFVFSAYTWSESANDEILAYKQNATVPACDKSDDCRLQKVKFPKSFESLTGLQIQAFIDNEEQMFFMDDLALHWTDNSCAAGLQRQSSL